MMHQRLPLPKAIEAIQLRLWPELTSRQSIDAIAAELGVSWRVVYDWRAGRTAVHHKNVPGLQALARRAEITITPESLIRGSGTRSRKK